MFVKDSSASAASPFPVIEDDSYLTRNPVPTPVVPRPITPPPAEIFENSLDLPPPDYTLSLQDLDRDKIIQRLYSLEHTPRLANGKASSLPIPLKCMTQDNIINKLHHPNLVVPPVHPCDTSNPSNTKSHWTAEELHRVTGCRRFWNYRHLMAVSKDGTFIDAGKFPVSIGAYTTLPKASRGQSIDRTTAKFLDVVHLDIAFGDCLSIGGFKYALIFVDRAMQYNWCFGLKTLQCNDLRASFLALRAEASGIARQFCCDCNEKLVGSGIRSFLHDNNSLIAASPAGRQSANGLVEPHWKIMVHMSRAYLTEKQMPRSFWYFAIKRSAI
jgi:hypothetical protein